MRLLVLATDPVSVHDVPGALPDEDLDGAEVLVVLPAVNESPVAFWVSDSDEAIADARSSAEETAEALRAEGARARATTGESEPLLALQDALATYQADRVLVYVRDEDGARYRYLEDLRWGDQPFCPHCGSVRKHYFLTPANGTSRRTRTGSKSERRVWKCGDCRKQFSVLTGTIFHGTRISVRSWVFVIFEMCASKNGVAAREIQRKYGLTPKSAWYMLHRIREAMKREPVAGLLSGRVVADETFIGGLPRNRHGGTKTGGLGVQGKTDKTPVMALVSRETGDIYAQVIANVNGDNLRMVMAERLDIPATHLQTDSSIHYKRIAGDFASHESVDHSIGEYVRGDVSTNVAENYFSQLKRSIDGTHHHVSREHLDRYLAEFAFRHSTCESTDAERMAHFRRRVAGKRLAYCKPRSRG